MTNRNDWLPGKRDDIILMAKKWQNCLAHSANDWNIPEAQVTEFNTALAAATTTLEAETADKSPHNVKAARLAVNSLTTLMRYIKRHFFLIPPLSDLDFTDLLLKQPDTVRTSIPIASNQGTVAEFKPQGAHIVKLVMTIIGALPDGSKKSWYGYRIYFAVVDPATVPAPNDVSWRHLTTAPQTGADLINSIYTKHTSYTFDFPETDRGKTVWFCIRLENAKGGAGPWGPLLWTIVP
ncbi:hypothetical protein FACS1894172_15740 [Spirochaetia bacterium]|nr:hypothetical protein FACS1894164_09570 [Spirochaetia bacterium]GHU34863.1 hypothetical protein FACS1894172_15740 [Spirochaetia bacterium]